MYLEILNRYIEYLNECLPQSPWGKTSLRFVVSECCNCRMHGSFAQASAWSLWYRCLNKNTPPEKNTLWTIDCKTPSHGLESSFCCWVAGQRLVQKDCSFTDTGSLVSKVCLRNPAPSRYSHSWEIPRRLLGRATHILRNTYSYNVEGSSPLPPAVRRNNPLFLPCAHDRISTIVCYCLGCRIIINLQYLRCTCTCMCFTLLS